MDYGAVSAFTRVYALEAGREPPLGTRSAYPRHEYKRQYIGR
jgi:hypothetical protein